MANDKYKELKITITVMIETPIIVEKNVNNPVMILLLLLTSKDGSARIP